MRSYRGPGTVLIIPALILGSALAACRGSDASGTVRLGGVLPLTGDTASYGKAAQRGLNLALKELAARGGAGQRLSIIYEDDQGLSGRAVSAFEKLASVDKVPVVIGSAGSSVTLAMCSAANRSKVVLATPISSSKDLSGCGSYFFRVCPSDVVQARLMADWLVEEGRKRVGVVYVNNSWGQGLLEEFQAAYRAQGGELVAVEATNEGDRELRAQLTKLKAASPEAVYAITYGREGGALLRQARELGLETPFYGADVWGSPELRETAGETARGVKIVAPSRLESPLYGAFAASFRAEYGEEPDVYAAYAYDLLQLVARGLEGGARGEALRARLRAMSYEGVTGLTRFNENGDVIGKGFERRTL